MHVSLAIYTGTELRWKQKLGQNSVFKVIILFFRKKLLIVYFCVNGYLFGQKLMEDKLRRGAIDMVCLQNSLLFRVLYRRM